MLVKMWRIMHCSWECKMVQLLWKILWRFPPKLNKESPYNPEIPLLDISVLKRIKSRDLNRYLHTHIHSSLIHHNQKEETTQMFIDGWMDKQCGGVCVCLYTHTIEYYSFLRNDILTRAVTWTNFEDVMLSEISQTQSTNILIPVIWST